MCLLCFMLQRFWDLDVKRYINTVLLLLLLWYLKLTFSNRVLLLTTAIPYSSFVNPLHFVSIIWNQSVAFFVVNIFVMVDERVNILITKSNALVTYDLVCTHEKTLDTCDLLTNFPVNEWILKPAAAAMHSSNSSSSVRVVQACNCQKVSSL